MPVLWLPLLNYYYFDKYLETMTMLIALIISWIAFGFITAKVAESKGRPFSTWLIYGFICFPLAMLYLAMSKPSDKTLTDSGKFRKCPFCAEMVRREAKLCRYCGKELPYPEPLKEEQHNLRDALIGIVAVIIFIFIFTVIMYQLSTIFH